MYQQHLNVKAYEIYRITVKVILNSCSVSGFPKYLLED